MTKSEGLNSRPAYSPWQTFDRALAFLKGPPAPITVERLGQAFHHDVASRLMSSLRTLHLVDDNGYPTKELSTLVSSRQTPLYEANLQALVRKNYAFLDGVKLEKADAAAVYAAFCNHTGLDDTTLRKSMSFFVNLAHAAGMPLSPSLQKRVKMSDASAALKARQKAADKTNRSSGAASTRRRRPTKRAAPPRSAKPAADAKARAVAQLLDKLPPFNPEWAADVQAQWLKTYDRLTAASLDKYEHD
jgi:hypothetical protein